MRRAVPWILPLVAVLAALLFISTLAPGHQVVAGPTASRPTTDSSAIPVTFGLNLRPTTSLTLWLSFSVNLTLSGGTAQPSELVNATANLTAPSTVPLLINDSGTVVRATVNPLGTTLNVPLPGLTYNYSGIATLSLLLNFSGSVTGTPHLQGPATGGTANLDWSASGKLTYAFTVSSTATSGSSVTWSLESIGYPVMLGLNAVGNVSGVPVSIPLFPFSSVGTIPGLPSAVSSVYSIPQGSPPSSNPPPSGGKPSNPSSPWPLLPTVLFWFIVGVLALVVVITLIARWRRKKPVAPLYPS